MVLDSLASALSHAVRHLTEPLNGIGRLVVLVVIHILKLFLTL